MKKQYKHPLSILVLLMLINIVSATAQPCANTLGNGSVLCFDNSNTDLISIYLAEGNTITQKIVDKTGRQLSSATVGNVIKDSILVVNNQVIKKWANGSIAFTKNITPSVLNRFPTINTALEMPDGTFVLAGYQKYFDPVFPPNNADSLVLVVTDANLTYQNSFVEARGGGPYTTSQDSVLQLIPYGTNRFVVAYYDGFSRLITWHNLLFTSFQKDNTGNLTRLNNGDYGYALIGKPILTSICGSNLIIQSNVSSYSQKGSFRGDGYALFNLDSMRPLTSKTVGTGNADYFGDYKTYSYVFNPNLIANKYALFANYSGNDNRIGINTFQDLDISFYDHDGNVTFKKTVPFVAFDHIIRTGDTTCLMLTNSNGQLFISNPDCNNPTNTLPDLTVSNLNIATPSVQQGQILYFKFDGNNIAEGNVPDAFTIKSYLSRDKILDAQDYQDGIISTANYTSGTHISQIQGAMKVGEFLVGNYYLILKIDADNQIAESNELNNTIISPVTITSGNNDNDIVLSLTSTPSVYRRYSTQNFKITAKNTGNQAFTDVKINFLFPLKTVSGGAVTPSVGAWQEWCAGGIQCFTWIIPNLAANTTATLDVPVYILDAVNPIIATALLLSSVPIDNSAGNNTASIIINPTNVPLVQPLILSKPTATIPVMLQRISPTITDNSIAVELESIAEKQTSISIINSLGTVVLHQQLMLEKGYNTFSFNVAPLPKGLYFIQTNVGKGRDVPTKFVKL